MDVGRIFSPTPECASACEEMQLKSQRGCAEDDWTLVHGNQSVLLMDAEIGAIGKFSTG